MIAKSKGVVLGYLKYGETSIIARILTEQFGYQSFIVSGIRSQKSKKSIGAFQPFYVLDLVVYMKESRDLQRVSEFKTHIALHSLHTDMTKSSIALFLSEVFSKLMRQEPSSNTQLYGFVEDSVASFEELKTGVGNFHIQFLLKLAAYLGYEIERADSLFSSIDRLAPSSDGYALLEAMILEPYGTQFELNKQMRHQIIDSILHFYQHHAGISWPKSLQVLKSVLS
ncbi:MAG: DNA repair protein RecO [Bacteroidota bacterium]